MKLIAKLKSDNDMREFAGISGEYDDWEHHFLFQNLRIASLKSIHPQKNGILLPSNNKYTFNTVGPALLVVDELIDKNTGTYQISFQDVASYKLKDIEVGVLPITYKKELVMSSTKNME
jgi:hypothetical protein